jgi:hypothetical protein
MPKKKGFATHNLAKLIMNILEDPFMKWGIAFVGLIKPTCRYTKTKKLL